MGCGRERRTGVPAALGAAIVASALAGCGQRGPLYLPVPPPEPPPRVLAPGSVVLQPARPAPPASAPAAAPTDDARRATERRTD